MVEKIISERGARLEFLSLQNEEGKDIYVYLLLKESDYPSFKAAAESGFIDIEKHGVIFMAGEGKEPPAEVKNVLKDFFGDKWTGN
ncbi:MAG: hypothetical protein SFT90_03175 [Rickettsiales bacterium]|nr:hypothetical protein [Rickettsiales bacterium]